MLTAKFWNSKYRQTCPITDDSKGITLQSLGGIFLATLVGLLISMITLAYEVWQQKKKEKETNKVKRSLLRKKHSIVFHFCDTICFEYLFNSLILS